MNNNENGSLGDEITFAYDYAGFSKLKGKGKILSKKGSYYNVVVTEGIMKGKTTDIHKSQVVSVN